MVSRPTTIFGRKDLLEGTDHDTLRRLAAAFPQELERVKRAYALSAQRTGTTTTPSPSQLLYQKEHPEVNRTLVGVLSLKWILKGDYHAFADGQPDATRLKQESFDDMRRVFNDTIVSDDYLHTLLVCIVCNDLGKDPELAADYARATNGGDITEYNHDKMLYLAIEAGLVPAYVTVPPALYDDVLAGMRLCADFNFGQLAQAENVPANLRGLRSPDVTPAVVHLRFLEIILDVSGAVGHADWSCAKIMTEPVWQGYLAAREAALAVVEGRFAKRGLSETGTLRAAYDVVLRRRIGLVLENAGDRHDFLCGALKDNRALTRMLCMGAVSDASTACLFCKAWEGLDQPTQDSLAEALDRDGTMDKPAVMVAYAPALFRAAAGDLKLAGENRILRIRAAMRYLARALELDGRTLAQALGLEDESLAAREAAERGVLVLERDIRPVIESAAFKKDPCSLDQMGVPSATVAVEEGKKTL